MHSHERLLVSSWFNLPKQVRVTSQCISWKNKAEGAVNSRVKNSITLSTRWGRNIENVCWRHELASVQLILKFCLVGVFAYCRFLLSVSVKPVYVAGVSQLSPVTPVHRSNFSKLLDQDFLSAGCYSGHPANIISLKHWWTKTTWARPRGCFCNRSHAYYWY